MRLGAGGGLFGADSTCAGGVVGLAGLAGPMLAMMPAMTAWKPGERLLVYFAAAGVEVEMLRSAGFFVTTLGLQTMAGLTAVM